MSKPSKKAALSAELDKKRKFAALFVAGLDKTKGNWSECNKTLGTEFVPCDVDIRSAILDLGGLLPPCETAVVDATPAFKEPQTPKEISAKTKAALPTQEADDKWRAKLSDLSTKLDEDNDWCRQWKEIESVWMSAAQGITKLSVSQTRVMMAIQERCFGRVGEEADEGQQSGVILLPTIGTGSKMHVCPRCGFTEEAIEQ